MPNEPTTIILRFRDLVTPPGETIKKHQEVCKTKGFVWWGWWNKLGERVPQRTFGELLSTARKSNLSVLLFDSGHNRVHRAVCVDIRWDPGGNRMASPDPMATPDYYKDTTYFAWFKFTDLQLDPADEGVLKSLTYVEVADFFESAASRYGRFYGKRIYDPEELRQQDRTIWFVRPASKSDPNHQIQLLDAHALVPKHFPDKYEQTSSLDLLWLSDMHFDASGEHHAFGGRKPGENKLELQVERALNELGVKPGGILVSGDITWRASPVEFAQARDSLRYLRSWAQIEPYQIAICPGNHDLAFSKEPADKETPVSEVGHPSRAAFEDFYEAFFYLKPNAALCSGRRLLLGKVRPVEIVCLNSSALQQVEKWHQGHGYIGQEQLELVEKEMAWTAPSSEAELERPRPFRVVMLHHHVVPVIYRQLAEYGGNYSTVLDAGALMRWLVKHRVNLVLHGHMHEPFYAKLALPTETGTNRSKTHGIVIVGMGSSGVGRKDIGEVGVNTFGLVRFGVSDVTVEVHSLDPVNPSHLMWTLSLRATE
jgi:hypothetical protein